MGNGISFDEGEVKEHNFSMISLDTGSGGPVVEFISGWMILGVQAKKKSGLFQDYRGIFKLKLNL